MSDVDFSIVSHGQSELVNKLIEDLNASDICCKKLVLTANIPESKSFIEAISANVVSVIENVEPHGFAANHNAAFSLCDAPFFCVLNPDLRMLSNPLPELLRNFDDPRVGIVAPLVVGPDGVEEDSARRFPTLAGLFLKMLGISDGRVARHSTPGAEAVDWAAGMFLLIRRSAMEEIGGFDADFFLYYEDVDLCARMHKAGWKVVFDARVSVIHEAQRQSRRSMRYLRWHLSSMLRYFRKHGLNNVRN